MPITRQQRKALELFFKIISDQFNNLGQTFTWNFCGLNFELPFTRIVARELLWKPIQKVLFDIDSTKDLDSHSINVIIDVLTKHFAEQGVGITFPSLRELLNQIDAVEELKRLEALENAKKG